MHARPITSRTVAAGAALGLTAVLALTGCSDSSGVSADGTVEITLAGPNQWSEDGSSFGKPWEDLIARFEKAEPKIKVKTNVLPLNDFSKTLSTQLSMRHRPGAGLLPVPAPAVHGAHPGRGAGEAQSVRPRQQEVARPVQGEVLRSRGRHQRPGQEGVHPLQRGVDRALLQRGRLHQGRGPGAGEDLRRPDDGVRKAEAGRIRPAGHGRFRHRHRLDGQDDLQHGARPVLRRAQRLRPRRLQGHRRDGHHQVLGQGRPHR